MKNEFIYAMRMYTLTCFQLGDVQKIKDLLIDLKFVYSWEDEKNIEKGQFKLTSESAFNNIFHLIKQS
jgi:hypothetical protein